LHHKKKLTIHDVFFSQVALIKDRGAEAGNRSSEWLEAKAVDQEIQEKRTVFMVSRRRIAMNKSLYLLPNIALALATMALV
jgi:hypothetical protein